MNPVSRVMAALRARARAMEASGVSELLKAIAERVIKGPGEAFLKDIRNELNAIITYNRALVNFEAVQVVPLGGGGF